MSQLRKRSANDNGSIANEDPLGPVARLFNGSNSNHHASASASASDAACISVVKDALKSVGSAYNVRSHLRFLFNSRCSGQTDSLSCLDGYRALLCIWMICYHSMAYVLEFAVDSEFDALSGHPLMLFIMFGFLPVDGFFVLTGFLLAQPIFQEEKKISVIVDAKEIHNESVNSNSQNLNFQPKSEKWFSVKNFHYRRIIRFLPTYFLAFFLYCNVLFPGGIQNPLFMVKSARMQQFLRSALGPTAENKPNSCQPMQLIGASFFLNNVLPFGGCMGWTWSLGVQFFFYLSFPIVIYYCLSSRNCHGSYILNHRRYLRFLLFLFVLTVFLRFSVYIHLRRFDESLGPVKVFSSFFFYSHPFLRISTMFLGSFVAYISVYYKDAIVEWRENTSKITREVQCTLVWLLVLSILLSQTLYNYMFDVPVGLSAPGAVAIRLSQQSVPYVTMWDGLDINTVGKHLIHWVYWALFIVGSPLCGLLFALLIFMVIHRIGFVSEKISDFLSLRVWSPLSILSFQAYLYHPMVMTRTYVALIALWDHIPLSIEYFAGYCVWNVSVTFGVSFIVWLLVEQPMDILLRPSKTESAKNFSKWSVSAVWAKLIESFALVVSALVPVANLLSFLIVFFGMDPSQVDRNMFQQLNQIK